jgi:hypothetical protein
MIATARNIFLTISFMGINAVTSQIMKPTPIMTRHIFQIDMAARSTKRGCIMVWV